MRSGSTGPQARSRAVFHDEAGSSNSTSAAEESNSAGVSVSTSTPVDARASSLTHPRNAVTPQPGGP